MYRVQMQNEQENVPGSSVHSSVEAAEALPPPPSYHLHHSLHSHFVAVLNSQRLVRRVDKGRSKSVEESYPGSSCSFSSTSSWNIYFHSLVGTHQQSLLQTNLFEHLLSVGTNLHQTSWLNERLHLLPVFTIKHDSFQEQTMLLWCPTSSKNKEVSKRR